jgi:hypothetical protein
MASHDAIPDRMAAAHHLLPKILGGHSDALLEAAGSYFEGGPGSMPLTWRCITRLVEDVTGQRLNAS